MNCLKNMQVVCAIMRKGGTPDRWHYEILSLMKQPPFFDNFPCFLFFLLTTFFVNDMIQMTNKFVILQVFYVNSIKEMIICRFITG